MVYEETKKGNDQWPRKTKPRTIELIYQVEVGWEGVLRGREEQVGLDVT